MVNYFYWNIKGEEEEEEEEDKDDDDNDDDDDSLSFCPRNDDKIVQICHLLNKSSFNKTFIKTKEN